MLGIKRIESEPATTYLNRLFEISDGFKRFNQKNDVFNRSVWDDTVDPKDLYKSYDITNYKPKKSKGFDHWDYALRNASWHLTDVIGEMKFSSEEKVEGFTDLYSVQTQGPPSPAPPGDPKDNARRIKKIASLFGAGMTGICQLDRRWLYSHKFNRKKATDIPFDIPATFTHAIVLIMPMSKELTGTFPSALAGASTGLGYGNSVHCVNSLAQFITNLGYDALASLNDSALAIPLAIQAGLGEYGRNGLLINPKFGSNLRIAKIFTNLPMQEDHPIDFGVAKFCEICRECSTGCPSKAIPKGEPDTTAFSMSNHQGIKKWTVIAEKCFRYWTNMNTDCAICIRVCPYTKDFSKWWHRVGMKLANSSLRKGMLYLHRYFKMGQRTAPAAWWEKSS